MMKHLSRAVLVLIVAALAGTAWAGGVNCPKWVGAEVIGEEIECWSPLVTYRENIALLHGDTPVYVTRIQQLVESEHTFDTRAELETYIQTVLVVRGFWLDHPTRCDNNGVRCLLVPPSAFEHIELRQIIDPGRFSSRTARPRRPRIE